MNLHSSAKFTLSLLDAIRMHMIHDSGNLKNRHLAAQDVDMHTGMYRGNWGDTCKREDTGVLYTQRNKTVSRQISEPTLQSQLSSTRIPTPAHECVLCEQNPHTHKHTNGATAQRY